MDTSTNRLVSTLDAIRCLFGDDAHDRGIRRARLAVGRLVLEEIEKKAMDARGTPTPEE